MIDKCVHLPCGSKLNELIVIQGDGQVSESCYVIQYDRQVSPSDLMEVI